jgi:hypothetical protein
VRAIGLDVHLEFCEVAIAEDGEVRSAGRIETKPEQIELLAQSLGKHDWVALEVTGNAWEIKRLIEPHVAEVLVVSRTTPGSARRGRRQTASTRGRWRGCSPPVSSTRSGSPTEARGGCADAFSAAASSSGRARGPRTRSTPP